MNKQTIVLRAGKAPFLIFGPVFGVSAAFLLYNAFFAGNVLNWVAAIISLGALVLLFMWLKAFRLELTEDAVAYKTLFTHSRELRYSEIEESVVTLGADNYRDRFRPTLRLNIQPYKNLNKPVITINIKVFDRTEIHDAIQVLNAKLQNHNKH